MSAIVEFINKVPSPTDFLDDVVEFETNLKRGQDYENSEDLDNIVDNYARDVAHQQLTGHTRLYYELYPDG